MAAAERDRAAEGYEEVKADIDDMIAGMEGQRTQLLDEEPYHIRSAMEALEPLPAIEWLVEGLLVPGSVNLLVGHEGSKKTYAMIDMSICLATGKAWLTLKTKQSRVLFIDEESGRRRFLDRMGRALRWHKSDTGDALGYTTLDRFKITTKKGPARLRRAIVEHKAQVVIVDALADIMPGADENSVKDVHPVFAVLRSIAEETRAAILVIHHMNKNGDGYRGSSAMAAAVDMLLTLDCPSKSLNLAFNTAKARDTEPFEFGAHAYFGDGQFHLEAADVSTFKRGTRAADRHIILFLKEHGKSRSNLIKSSAENMDPETVRTRFSALRKKGLIDRDDDGNTTEATWRLTEAGEKQAEKWLLKGE